MLTAVPKQDAGDLDQLQVVRALLLVAHQDRPALAEPSQRALVKRILRKNGYPPDKQEQATRTVLEQAEVLSQEWVVV